MAMENNKKYALVLFVLSATLVLGSITDAYADEETLTLIKHVKNQNGGIAGASSFELTATGDDGNNPLSGFGTPKSQADVIAEITFVVDDEVVYTLSESAILGYTDDGWKCVGGKLAQVGNTIEIDDDGHVTCTIVNTDGADTDGDGVPDVVDNCPFNPNPDQADNSHHLRCIQL